MSGSRLFLIIHLALSPISIFTQAKSSLQPLRSPFTDIPAPASEHLDDLWRKSNRKRHPDEYKTLMYGICQRQLRPYT